MLVWIKIDDGLKGGSFFSFRKKVECPRQKQFQFSEFRNIPQFHFSTFYPDTLSYVGLPGVWLNFDLNDVNQINNNACISSWIRSEKLIWIELVKSSRIKPEIESSVKTPMPMTAHASDKWCVSGRSLDTTTVIVAIMLLLEVPMVYT